MNPKFLQFYQKKEDNILSPFVLNEKLITSPSCFICPISIFKVFAILSIEPVNNCALIESNCKQTTSISLSEKVESHFPWVTFQIFAVWSNDPVTTL